MENALHYFLAYLVPVGASVLYGVIIWIREHKISLVLSGAGMLIGTLLSSFLDFALSELNIYTLPTGNFPGLFGLIGFILIISGIVISFFASESSIWEDDISSYFHPRDE